MPLTPNSQTFWIRTLLSVTCLFNVSNLSDEMSPIQNNKTKNSSKLFHEHEIISVSLKIPKRLSVHIETSSNTSTTPGSDEAMFRWNKTTSTAREFQLSYCSRQCRGNRLVMPRGDDQCLQVKCFPCGCNKPMCEFYGTCCPESVGSKTTFDNEEDTTNQHWNVSDHDESTANLDNDITMGLVCDGSGGHDNFSKRSCPANYPDDDVKFKCLNDIPTAEQDVDTFLHVSSNITGHTYHNEFCANCNNVSHFTAWTLEVKCEDYMSVYPSRTPAELLRLSLSSDSRCQTFQRPADMSVSHACDRHWFASTIVDTCNVTGEWDIFDEDVVKACADISGIVNRVIVFDNIVYKNLFCAICNIKVYPAAPKPCQKFAKANVSPFNKKIRLPFSVILNFGSHGSLTPRRSEVTKCSEDSDWTSPDNKCFPLQCSPGKILTNGSCSTAFSQIRGLLYQVQVHYVPCVLDKIRYEGENTTLKTDNNSDFRQMYLNLFKNSIERVVSHPGHEFQISNAMVFSDKNYTTSKDHTDELVNTPQLFQINRFTVDGFIQANYSLSRDDVETFIINELFLNNITVDIDTNTTFTLIPVLCPHRKQTHVNCISNSTEIMSWNISSLIYGNQDFNELLSQEKRQQAIIMEPHLNCVFVKFEKTEYLYQRDVPTTPDGSSITLYFKGARMVISGRAELNMVSINEDETMRICLELLKTVDVINGDFINNSLLTVYMYLLTLICLIVSVLCLTMALMTYFLFPMLRSVAGKNNMFLGGSLLMAQLSLLATSHVSETGLLCTLLAICTHFLWLSMFCWCFTCCFHMFCVFSAKTRSLPSTVNSEKAYMIKRIVACSVIPGLTVAGVITTNYKISSGQLIGYGNDSCFLDSRMLVIIALVVPLCSILLLNFIFFLITVFKIYNVGKLQTRDFSKNDHNNLFVYIKLSSMTGIFWIFSVISEATDTDPLRCIAIGLNGLQGVFIFLSYICNKRVLRLYLKLLGFENYLATTSASDKSTIAKILASVDKQSHGCEESTKS